MAPEPDPATEADRCFDAVRALMRRSEYLRAFDQAKSGVARHEEHLGLRHLGVLALARMGATRRAKALFLDWGLDRTEGDEEVLALWGRLLKDEAALAPAAGRLAALAEAAGAYQRAFESGGGGYFPAINVASLSLLAGDQGRAQTWARRARALAGDGADYFSAATLAEAALILDDTAGAKGALERAAQLAGGDYAAMATTRTQLTAILAHQGRDLALLAPLAAPKVAHFCGHIVAPAGRTGRFVADDIPQVQAEIQRTLAASGTGFAMGSLAAGADIMIAEAVLATGGELTVVLPFDRAEFIEVSVRPSGPDWVDRFERCLAAATDVHFVTEEAYLGHDALFTYASHLALGLARLRSQMLGAQMCQIAVWDGTEPGPADLAGTGVDVARGREIGLVQHIIPVGSAAQRAAPPTPPLPQGSARACRTMVFGDLKGFSKLSDVQLPAYVETVLGACARTLDQHADHLTFRNTWGDGLFLVFDDLASAARCAFDLQDAITGLDRAGAGLPETLDLRLGLHYGPVFETEDPVLRHRNYFGYHVSRAARVEPITPEGEVYVTEPAAAALAVDSPDAFQCDYVGRVPLAKDYGEFPMYALTRRTTRT